MDKDIVDINNGFVERDNKKIYLSLLSYIQNNKQKIFFQKHPLGFKYFKLGKISDTEEFRLHFWIGTHDNQDNDLQIHDHSFDFESFVVYGSLKNTKFSSKKNKIQNGFIYDVKFRNEKSRLVLNSSEQGLEISSCEIIKTGNFYYLKSDEFHRSENINNLTISVLKIIKPVNKIAHVFSPKKLTELHSFDRSLISTSVNQNLIDQMIYVINLGKNTVL